MSGTGGGGRGWRGPGWRGARWRGPGPPPWWPQGEAWPPAGRPPWRRGAHFMWRLAWFMTAAFLLIAVVLTIGVVLVGTAVGLIHAHPPVRILAVASLLLGAPGTMTLADVDSLRLHREPVEVGVLVHSSLAAFQSLADSGGVRLTAEIAGDTPAIDADPVRIRSVLANLLSNAIRHTPSGGSVIVPASRAGETVTIAVRDTGEGIPEDVRSRVFERFVKGPGSPGAGLGLAIAKDIVTAHGGSIDLTSEVGKRTEVRVTLPIAR